MGRDKALVQIQGVPMLERVLHAAGSLGANVIVVGRSEAPGGVRAVPDGRTGTIGPLAGIETALQLGAGRQVVVVAVDQPFVRPETLRKLADSHGDAIVPVDIRSQVTCAVYRPACLAPTTDLLDSGSHAVTELLDRVTTRFIERSEWTGWGEDGRSWWSVDTAEDADEAATRFG